MDISVRPALTRLLALLLGAATLTTWSAPGQAAVVPESVSVNDKPQDVRIFRKVKGLSRAERTSIDLRRVDVTPGDEAVRFTVRLRTVLRTRDFHQMVFIDLTPAPSSTATWVGMIGLSPQLATLSYAGLDADGTGTDYESCDPLRLKVHRRTNEVTLDVPNRCIPEGEVSIAVKSLTGYFRSDAGRPWSQDRLRFPDPVVLR